MEKFTKYEFVTSYRALTVVVKVGELHVPCDFKDGKFTTDWPQLAEALRSHHAHNDTFVEQPFTPTLAPRIYDVELWNGDDVRLDIAGDTNEVLHQVKQHCKSPGFEVRVRLNKRFYREHFCKDGKQVK